jgi:uncharacterized protein with von Willebrand factor type A (vWA) domain
MRSASGAGKSQRPTESEPASSSARSFSAHSSGSPATARSPVQGGIVAALPHLDALLAGHSLATLEELMELIRDA